MQIPPAVIRAFGCVASTVAQRGPELAQCAAAAWSAHAARTASAPDPGAAGDEAQAHPPLRHPPGAALSQRLHKRLDAGQAAAKRQEHEQMREQVREQTPEQALEQAQEKVTGAQEQCAAHAMQHASDLMEVLGKAG